MPSWTGRIWTALWIGLPLCLGAGRPVPQGEWGGSGASQWENLLRLGMGLPLDGGDHRKTSWVGGSFGPDPARGTGLLPVHHQGPLLRRLPDGPGVPGPGGPPRAGRLTGERVLNGVGWWASIRRIFLGLAIFPASLQGAGGCGWIGGGEVIPIPTGEGQRKQDSKGKPPPTKPQKGRPDFSLSELDALLESLPGSAAPTPAPKPPLPAPKEPLFASLDDLLADLKLPELAPPPPTGARPAAQAAPPPPGPPPRARSARRPAAARHPPPTPSCRAAGAGWAAGRSRGGGHPPGGHRGSPQSLRVAGTGAAASHGGAPGCPGGPTPAGPPPHAEATGASSREATSGGCSGETRRAPAWQGSGRGRPTPWARSSASTTCCRGLTGPGVRRPRPAGNLLQGPRRSP
jgi:hypothetical protein